MESEGGRREQREWGTVQRESQPAMENNGSDATEHTHYASADSKNYPPSVYGDQC